VQKAVVARFPNVSAIDLALLLQTLEGIFSKVELVVRFIALFTVATGIIVLAGAVMTGRFQRIRETVLLRTLGASRTQIARIQLVEYMVLGVLAALTGGGLAFGANALLAIFVFEAPVVWPLGYLAVTVAGVTVVTLITGWIANRGIATHPPLAVLREES
jgi:putative ABC transport system permease protein